MNSMKKLAFVIAIVTRIFACRSSRDFKRFETLIRALEFNIGIQAKEECLN